MHVTFTSLVLVRFLILKISNDNYAVDLRDLIGYEIEEGNQEISLQTSLRMVSKMEL